MSYTKILLIQIAAKQAYDEGTIDATQYLHILTDLENDILKLDIKNASEDFTKLIELYS